MPRAVAALSRLSGGRLIVEKCRGDRHREFSEDEEQIFGVPHSKAMTSRMLIPNSFAPLQVPRQRRIQTATVAIWSLMLPICFIFFLLLWYAASPSARNQLTASQFNAALLAFDWVVPYLGLLL